MEGNSFPPISSQCGVVFVTRLYAVCVRFSIRGSAAESNENYSECPKKTTVQQPLHSKRSSRWSYKKGTLFLDTAIEYILK